MLLCLKQITLLPGFISIRQSVTNLYPFSLSNISSHVNQSICSSPNPFPLSSPKVSPCLLVFPSSPFSTGQPAWKTVEKHTSSHVTFQLKTLWRPPVFHKIKSDIIHNDPKALNMLAHNGFIPFSSHSTLPMSSPRQDLSFHFLEYDFVRTFQLLPPTAMCLAPFNQYFKSQLNVISHRFPDQNSSALITYFPPYVLSVVVINLCKIIYLIFVFV